MTHNTILLNLFDGFSVPAQYVGMRADAILPIAAVDELIARPESRVEILTPPPVFLQTSRHEIAPPELLNRSVIAHFARRHRHPESLIAAYVIYADELARPEHATLCRYRYGAIERARHLPGAAAWRCAIDEIRADRHLASTLLKSVFERQGDRLSIAEEQQILFERVGRSSLEKLRCVETPASVASLPPAPLSAPSPAVEQAAPDVAPKMNDFAHSAFGTSLSPDIRRQALARWAAIADLDQELPRELDLIYGALAGQHNATGRAMQPLLIEKLLQADDPAKHQLLARWIKGHLARKKGGAR